MKSPAKCMAIVTLTLAINACTTTGTGAGQLTGASGQDQPVTFTWTSKDGGNSGSMMASLPGKSYQGRFFQITQQTSVDTLTPLWGHWRHGWNDWPYWSSPMGPDIPSTQFITHYSGKVVATLDAGDDHMRCRFHLVEPARGMSGGGEGECQLSAGRAVHARF